jgi:hypothetical protein
MQNETNRKVVFDGTYTARKGDVNINKVYIDAPTNSPKTNSGENKITFYVTVDGEEVATVDAFGSGNEESFSDIKVKAGESVKVKVEAEIEAYGDVTSSDEVYTIVILGSDVNGNENTGRGSDNTASIRIKSKGSVTIPATSTAKNALLKAQNTTIAEFTIKPSNNNDGITLDDLVLSGNIGGTGFVASDLRVKVDGVEQDDGVVYGTTGLKYSVNEEIPSAGLKVEVILKGEKAGKAVLNVAEVNGKSFTNTYSKYLVESLVTFTKQDEGTTSTEYTVAVEHFDDAFSVKDFTIYSGDCSNANTGNWTVLKTIGDIADGDTFTVMRGDKAVEICGVTYTVD